MNLDLYTREQVQAMTHLSRSSIYVMMKDGTFPKPLKLGERRVAWRGSDLKAWLEGRPFATIKEATE